VTAVQVDLAGGAACYQSPSPVSREVLASLIKAAGYELAEN
jgi:hypothetical protein